MTYNAKWYRGYEHLHRFCKKYGHSSPLTKEVCSDGFRLGSWCNHQRHAKSKGTLSKERIKLLNAVDFKWNSPGVQWTKGYLALKQYRQKHGTTHVPVAYITSEGFRLGIWCNNQRARHGRMRRDRVELLNKITFLWKVRVLTNQSNATSLDKSG